LVAFIDVEFIDFDVGVAFGTARHKSPRRIGLA
jgi:hypothetical protein